MHFFENHLLPSVRSHMNYIGIIIITTTYYGATQQVLSSASQTIHYKHNVGCTNTVVNLVWKISKF